MGRWLLAIIFASGLMAADVAAEPPRKVAHGSRLQPAMVGPAAAGIPIRVHHGGATIKDGQTYPFAREITQDAVYDGYMVSGPHLLIEGVHFSGSLDIYATKPVVMRGSIVRPAANSHWAIHTRPQAGALHFLWSESGGARLAASGVGEPVAIGVALFLRAGHEVIYRSRVSRSIDGIRPSGSHLRVIENVIDQLTDVPGAHIDGIQIMGPVRDIAIVRNRIINANPQTSAIAIAGNDIRIEGNYLAGGGWTVYGGWHRPPSREPPVLQIRMIDNIFGRDLYARAGNFGAVTAWDKTPEHRNVWSGNRFSTGEALVP